MRIEYFYERISILRKKQLINKRYTCGKIVAPEIQIRGEVGAHALRFWTLVTEVKCLGCLHVKNTKTKTASTQLLIYVYTIMGRPDPLRGSGEKPPDGLPQRYEAAS